MVIIPELKTIVILVPRTATTSLRIAIQSKYKKSMLLYRHMEADGIPIGYECWDKVGVIRHPVERLFSLYKLLKQIQKINISFNEWLINNNKPFLEKYTDPFYRVNHPIPDNKKSQYVYLRPDLGTDIFKFNCLELLEKRLKINMGKHHESDQSINDDLTKEAQDHINKYFAWDLSQS